jgi:hypothetical protein
MSDAIYKKLKKQNGEKFAQTIRNHHNGLLEVPNILSILRHAGHGADDVQGVLPYLMTLLQTGDQDNTPPATSRDPFKLLEDAGYDAFHADTLEKQNSIQHYFQRGELLCTFNDASRYQTYHIVHAVKKNVDDINRIDFSGKEKRQDEYGTSVISIQMLKSGGSISIKNRYNHVVPGCDNTFHSDPDNIIHGLSNALQLHFNVDFAATKSPLPEGFALSKGKIIKFHTELNNFRYGDQFWEKDGIIHEINRGRGDALFEGFLFNNQTKTLEPIDPKYPDKFDDDFNRAYGGNRALKIDKAGNLTLDGNVLIGAENSRIKTINLPKLKIMSDNSLQKATSLKIFTATHLESMGNRCLQNSSTLTTLDVPNLITMGSECLKKAGSLTTLNILKLKNMGSFCFKDISSLTTFHAPLLEEIDYGCLKEADCLITFDTRNLREMGHGCLEKAISLTTFNAPNLEIMGKECLNRAHSLTTLHAPNLQKMGAWSLRYANSLVTVHTPQLKKMETYCLECTPALMTFYALHIETMEDHCLEMYQSKMLKRYLESKAKHRANP